MAYILEVPKMIKERKVMQIFAGGVYSLVPAPPAASSAALL